MENAFVHEYTDFRIGIVVDSGPVSILTCLPVRARSNGTNSTEIGLLLYGFGN